jgi:hypothetical protein
MKFKHYILFAVIASVLLFLSTRKESHAKTSLEAEIDILGQLTEIPNSFEHEISFLKDSCTKNELIGLMDNDKPIIRAFSFLAILERKDINWYHVLKTNLDDTTKIVHWYFDDAANSVMLSDFYLACSVNRLNDDQKKKLIDEILLNHFYLQNTYWILEEIESDEKYYGLIKRAAQVQKDHCNQERIICALAKFKKESDIPLIKRIIEKSNCDFLTFRIIENWPDQRFFEILENHFKENVDHKSQYSYDDIEDYSYALASFKNKRSLELLEKLTLKETYKDPYYKDANREFVFKAIRYYKCPLYMPLFDKLKKIVDPYIVNDNDLRFEHKEFTPWTTG